jgi:hypothetical protein
VLSVEARRIVDLPVSITLSIKEAGKNGGRPPVDSRLLLPRGTIVGSIGGWGLEGVEDIIEGNVRNLVLRLLLAKAHWLPQQCQSLF